MAKTILVADDSKTIRRVVEMTFEKTGFEVVTAASAHEALDQAPGLAPAVVLADVAMADGDGYGLCTMLKQQATTAHIPVLLLAGPSSPIDEGKAQMARADGHINKPFDSGDLIDLVRRVTGEAVDADMPKSFAATLSQRSPEGVLTPRAAPPPTPPPSIDAPAPVVARDSDIPVMSEDIEIEDDVLIEEAEAAVESPMGPSLEPPAPPTPEADRSAVDMWALAEGGGTDLQAEAIEEIDIEDEPEELPMEDAVEVVAPAETLPEEADQGTFEVPTRDVHQDDPTRDMSAVPEIVAAAAAPKVADVVAPATPGLSKEELTALAREVIEQVAWEVVPDLAETIIREELKRLTAAD